MVVDLEVISKTKAKTMVKVAYSQRVFSSSKQFAKSLVSAFSTLRKMLRIAQDNHLANFLRMEPD